MKRKAYPTNWRNTVTGGPLGPPSSMAEYKQVRKHAKKLKKLLKKSNNKSNNR